MKSVIKRLCDEIKMRFSSPIPLSLLPSSPVAMFISGACWGEKKGYPKSKWFNDINFDLEKAQLK